MVGCESKGLHPAQAAAQPMSLEGTTLLSRAGHLPASPSILCLHPSSSCGLRLSSFLSFSPCTCLCLSLSLSEARTSIPCLCLLPPTPAHLTPVLASLPLLSCSPSPCRTNSRLDPSHRGFPKARLPLQAHSSPLLRHLPTPGSQQTTSRTQGWAPEGRSWQEVSSGCRGRWSSLQLPALPRFLLASHCAKKSKLLWLGVSVTLGKSGNEKHWVQPLFLK